MSRIDHLDFGDEIIPTEEGMERCGLSRYTMLRRYARFREGKITKEQALAPKRDKTPYKTITVEDMVFTSLDVAELTGCTPKQGTYRIRRYEQGYKTIEQVFEPVDYVNPDDLPKTRDYSVGEHTHNKFEIMEIKRCSEAYALQCLKWWEDHEITHEQLMSPDMINGNRLVGDPTPEWLLLGSRTRFQPILAQRGSWEEEFLNPVHIPDFSFQGDRCLI